MTPATPPAASAPGRRLLALIRKESLQVVRDPSSILIAFVLPVVLLFLYANAISLELKHVPIGVVLETDGANARALAAAFSSTTSFEVTPARSRQSIEPDLVAGRLRGMVVIPQDFERRLASTGSEPAIQIVTDGAEPNTASFVGNYAQGVFSQWLASTGRATSPAVRIEPRFWYNPAIDSRQSLLPGAIAIIMTVIGTLLTALVVSREWERGTMEAVFSTPATIPEILIGKLLPYFVLGLCATLGSALLVTHVFAVPLRGSWLALFMLSSVFLVPALGQGLLISALARNQFIAAQLALISGFLPAFLLSGFLYETASMPLPVRVLSHIVAARYFVVCLKTVFLVGDVWSVFLPNIAAMLGIGGLFLLIATRRTRKTLDS